MTTKKTHSDKNYEKLRRLLSELFQLDQADLDFGIYRIMAARRDEILRFLDEDLKPQVAEAFSDYETADNAHLEKQLDEAKKKAEEIGVDPETAPQVKEIESQLDEALDTAALEADVYNHLVGFFSRYYREGDFISQRRYKNDVYAIPYEGEEVKLHWANHNQYYIKTAEHLRHYAFRLPNGKRVRFELVAADPEEGNVKPAPGKERRFILHEADPVVVHGDDLVIRFERRPDAEGRKQAELNADARSRILSHTESKELQPWIAQLSTEAPTDNDPDRTLLDRHLARWTARNTFDYFIHKDLRGFLRRELDFYLKNEVLYLEELEKADAEQVKEQASRTNVIRLIGHKVIDFLAQLEDFQKALWLKRKFVLDAQYCVTVDKLLAVEDDAEREYFIRQILENDSQRKEWVELFAIDEIDSTLHGEAYTEPLSPEFLTENQHLIVDTKHFGDDFKRRVLRIFDDIDAELDGVLIHSENFQGLELIRRRYERGVDCIYIDPPYNSKTTEILYKNDYKHSSWLSLMDNRLAISASLAADAGSHVVAIDENEQERLGLLLAMRFPEHDLTCVPVIHNKKGIQGSYFSYCHDYAYFCIPPALREIGGKPIPEDQWEYDNLRKWGRESGRETAKNCFYPIYVEDGEIVDFGDVCPEDFHPDEANVPCKGDRIAVYPVDSKGTEKKWRYARQSVEDIRHLLKVHVTQSGEIQIHKAKAEAPIKTIWDDPLYIAGDYGTRWLTELGLKFEEDLYPKSVHTVKDSIYAVARGPGVVLDYFAGSGTTAHAVAELSRADGERRKYVLVEMGHHFDTILVPRVKKVAYSKDWKEGKPQSRDKGMSHAFKYLRLESYEDALNNVELERSEQQTKLLGMDAWDASTRDVREDYVLRYLLDVESRDSLLDLESFTEPFEYKLRLTRNDETRHEAVDLVETFNWLLGLAVQTHEDLGDLRVVGGTNPDGKRVLVLWRAAEEFDNDKLDAWFKDRGFDEGKQEFDLLYVNGDNNLENLRAGNHTWEARLTETEFHRLMFAAEGV